MNVLEGFWMNVGGPQRRFQGTEKTLHKEISGDFERLTSKNA